MSNDSRIIKKKICSGFTPTTLRVASSLRRDSREIKSAAAIPKILVRITPTDTNSRAFSATSNVFHKSSKATPGITAIKGGDFRESI